MLATHYQLVPFNAHLQLPGLEPASVDLVGEIPTLAKSQLRRVVAQSELVVVVEEVVKGGGPCRMRTVRRPVAPRRGLER